jgi:hypothetical protein
MKCSLQAGIVLVPAKRKHQNPVRPLHLQDSREECGREEIKGDQVIWIEEVMIQIHPAYITVLDLKIMRLA